LLSGLCSAGQTLPQKPFPVSDDFCRSLSWISRRSVVYYLTVLGDAREVDPNGCANAELQTLSSHNRCIRYDTGEDRRAEFFSGHTVELSVQRVDVQLDSGSPALRFGVWTLPLVARTSTCFTSSGPTLTRAGSYPTFRRSDKVPCLGIWSRVGQHDCFCVKTGRMAGAERGNTVRARWHLRTKGTNARWQRAGSAIIGE
jgi:hypothetical protein